MFQQKKKQSFIQEALGKMARYLEPRVHPKTLEHFQIMMEQYLKQSFKNGINVGFDQARGKPVKDR